MRRNSNSLNSQIPMTQSPPSPPNPNLLRVRPKPLWRGAAQWGSGELSTAPWHQYPCTHPCQTLGLFKCRITLTSLKVQFCSHLLGKQSFFPCGLSQLGAG